LVIKSQTKTSYQVTKVTNQNNETNFTTNQKSFGKHNSQTTKTITPNRFTSKLFIDYS